nr:acyl-CoA dehydrogenase family protein [Micromonospora sp. DSM 115978]
TEPDGGVGLYLVTPGTAGVSVTAKASYDGTTRLGAVALDGAAGERLPGSSTAVFTDLVDRGAVLTAADLVGLSREALSRTVEYDKTRTQFGRPVGSFQAVKHACADMFVQTTIGRELLVAAVRAVADDGPGASVAVAMAKSYVCGAAVDVVGKAMQLHGGIGYTWEHDTHLYWRRAMTLENLLGPVSGWEHRLGELVRDGAVRDFSVDLPESDPVFRARIAGLLAEAAAVSDPKQRQAKLAADGLVLPHYPEPFGLAATPVEQVVILQEYEKSGVKQPKTIIGEWALPTILAHGTAEQKDYFVPATLRGDVVWCQLFSEPGAGSDLAALSTRAEKVDGGWRLNGQKVWTSSAHQAHFGICLARTDPDLPKHKGISYFLVDMTSPGLEVRPLREANGGFLFNEVFFNDVFVPDDRLVGEVNQGWSLARTTLGNERVSMGGMLDMRVDLLALLRS